MTRSRSSHRSGPRRAVPAVAAVVFGVAALAAVGPGALAQDSVDLQVQAKDKVLGTLRPVGERESFLVPMLPGDTVTATLKRSGRTGPVPQLEFLDGDLDGFTTPEVTSSGAKLRRFAIETADDYRFRVSGDGVLDGDYQLKLKVKSQRRWSQTADAELDTEGQAEFRFWAPVGSTFTVTLKRKGKSGLVPHVARIQGPAAFDRAFEAPDSGSRHRVGPFTANDSGEFVVEVRNAGDEPGLWKASCKVKPVKPIRRTIDLRDEALTGEYDDEQPVFGRLVGSTGGVVDPPDDGSSLDGAVLTIPEGALDTPTILTVAEANEFFVDDDTFASGLSVSLGPSGTQFAVPIDVTLPFDGQGFDDPESELQIFVEDSQTGELELIPGPYVFDDDSVTFPVSHFSGFQATSPRARPFRGKYVELEIASGQQSAFGGGIRFALNELEGSGGPRSGNQFARVVDRRDFTFGVGQPGTFQGSLTRTQETADGTVLLGAQDEVQFDDASIGARTLFRGRSRLALNAPGPGGDESGVVLALRRVQGEPTPKNLHGRWEFVVWEFATEKLPDGSGRLTETGQTGSLEFRPDGTVRAKGTRTVVNRADFPRGRWNAQDDTRRPAPGRFTIQGQAVVLEMALGTAPELADVRLIPTHRGAVLVGVSGETQGPSNDVTRFASRLVLLMRADDPQQQDSPAFGVKGGRFRFFGLAHEFISSTSVTSAPVRIGAVEERYDLVHEQEVVRIVGTERRVTHGLDGRPQVEIGPRDDRVPFRLGKDGGYGQDGPARGGVAVRGGALIVLPRFDANRFSLGFGLRARPRDE